MKEFLLWVFVLLIIILITTIICFTVRLIIYNKQLSTRNYDMESVLDRWVNAETQFQKDEKMKYPYSDEELEKEAIENTVQYMNEHMEKYNCENTKLETDNYNVGLECGYKDGYIAAVKSREKMIDELKKENTKLKERNAELAGQKANLERWLGEAKTIIRKYYNYNHICGYSYEAIDKQAEQFLNSEVEK